MPGKTSHLNPLESRKQMLVAESELNRAVLEDEWQAMAHGVRDFAHRAKNIAAWASSAALVVAGVTALWRRAPPPRPPQPEKEHRVLGGVCGVVEFICLFFAALFFCYDPPRRLGRPVRRGPLPPPGRRGER